MPHDIHAEVEEHVAPVRGNRRQYGGFWDGAASAASIPTSRDPKLVEAYLKRQEQLGLPGRWRAGHNPKAYRNKGTQWDIDYAIINW